jgi:hypothetical protein
LILDPGRKELDMIRSIRMTAVVAVCWGAVGWAQAQPMAGSYQIQQPMVGSYALQQPLVGTYQLQQPLIGSYQLQQPLAADDYFQRYPAGGYYYLPRYPVGGYYYLQQPGYGDSPWDDTGLEMEAPGEEP